MAVIEGNCTKVVYTSEQAADRAAKAYNLLNGAQQEKYLCPLCNFHHLRTIV